MKRFICKNLITLIIDIIAILLVIASFIVENKCLSEYSEQIPFYNTNIIVSLLPAIVTIISISLQLHDDKIFGTKIRDYQKLRHNHFNLLHMVLITAVIFAVELVIQILKQPITAITVSAIAFIYSVIFSFFELPILMKKESSVIRIIKLFLIKQNKDSQEENSIYDNSLKRYIVERGIKASFINLKGKGIKDCNLLDVLLSKQNEFLNTYLESVTIYKRNDFLSNEEENALLILNSCFTSINDLLDLNDNFNYLIFDKNGISVYHLTRLTFLTHQLSKTLEFKNEISRFKGIMKLYYWRREKTNVPALYVNYISAMMSYTLQSEEDWFLKAYRDYDYSSIFADVTDQSMDYFLLMLLCFISNSKYVSKGKKEFINKLIGEPKDGLNATGSSWKETIIRTIENYSNQEKLFFALKNFLDLSRKLNDGTCDIIPARMTAYSYDDNTHFSTGLIIDYWLQILLNHPYLYFDKEEILPFLEELPQEEGDIIAKVFENRYLFNETGGEEKPSPFFDFLFEPTTKTYNTKLESVMREFVLINNARTYEKNHQHLTNDILFALKNQEDKAVIECVSKYRINKEIEFMEEDIYSRNIWLEGEKDDFSSLLEMYLKELEYSINNLVRDYLMKNAEKNLFSGTRYSSDVIEQIISFEPDIMGEHEWLLGISCDKEQANSLNIKKISRVDYLPNGMFAKKDGVSLNIEYCKDCSMPRFATDKEINDIIDSEYVPTNGLYTFSKYKGIRNGSFLVTREELFYKLKDRIIVVPLTIKLKVVLNKKQILFFTAKK